jgi:hypothetical protein
MKQRSLPDWINKTGFNFRRNMNDHLGFIYQITMNDGGFYIGRKQFWRKAGSDWKLNDWETYSSSSKNIAKDIDNIKSRSVLAVFSSKSCLRYAEALAIISSGAYWPDKKGINWSFDGCKGTLKMVGTDEDQMKLLLTRWR